MGIVTVSPSTQGLICILHNVTPSTWDGGRGGAHLHRQSVSLYIGWMYGRGSFDSFTMSLPLPGMEVELEGVHTKGH